MSESEVIVTNTSGTGGGAPKARKLMPMLLPLILIVLVMVMLFMPRGGSTSTSSNGTYQYTNLVIAGKTVTINTPKYTTVAQEEAYENSIITQLKKAKVGEFANADATLDRTNADARAFAVAIKTLVKQACTLEMKVSSDKMNIALGDFYYMYQVAYYQTSADVVIFDNERNVEIRFGDNADGQAYGNSAAGDGSSELVFKNKKITTVLTTEVITGVFGENKTWDITVAYTIK